ncbi:MAG: multicopper oxidase family protein, partial [Phycisphaerales bacterium]|nr:multicopper oxidase family protein [Phycisphaerales bacterium]
FDPIVSASQVVGAEDVYEWTGAGLIADVQAWLDDPASNHGWFLYGNESESGTTKRFDSRENPNAGDRPVLIVDFILPATVGACCQEVGSCVITTEAECVASNGAYLGDGTACIDNPCGLSTGACCDPGGDCSILSEPDCLAGGGVYFGDDSVCTPNPCAPPDGACCLDDGSCVATTEDACIALSGTWQGDGSSCLDADCPVVLEPFVDPLPIPAVAQPLKGRPGGAATYQMDITEFTQQLHRDLPPTTVWGYAGTFPGPTIEATTDEPVTVLWHNDLRDETGALRTEHILPVDLCLHGPDTEGATARTVAHLHGGHIPWLVDGYPEFTALPGETQEYVYPNHQPAATLWYHDHALGITRLNVYMGLAGFYLIRDADESALSLPTGEYEIPIVIQDRSFHADGSFRYPDTWQEMYFGDTIVVNGAVWPYAEVKRGKYRFRLLNGSNSRTYTLALDDGRTFRQIGSDGGLLEAPVALTSLTIMPGERADIVVDFQDDPLGAEILLVNSAPAPFPGAAGVGVVPNIMKFVVTGGAAYSDPLPDTLRVIEPLDEAEAVIERDFELRKYTTECNGSWWLVNGVDWHHIHEYPVLGTSEVWRFINRSGMAHPMHMHLVFFQVLDRQMFEVVEGEIVPLGDPVPPAPNEAGWKDTIRVEPNELVRVIARFEDYTGRYAYHCHILEHEDHEMMRQYQTVMACPGDFDDDGTVGPADLASLLAAWGPCAGACLEDLDLSGDVGPADLAAMLANWGPCR